MAFEYRIPRRIVHLYISVKTVFSNGDRFPATFEKISNFGRDIELRMNLTIVLQSPISLSHITNPLSIFVCRDARRDTRHGRFIPCNLSVLLVVRKSSRIWTACRRRVRPSDEYVRGTPKFAHSFSLTMKMKTFSIQTHGSTYDASSR